MNCLVVHYTLTKLACYADLLVGLARIRVGVKGHPHSVQSSPAPLAKGQEWGKSSPPCQFSTIKHLKNHVGFDVCFLYLVAETR